MSTLPVHEIVRTIEGEGPYTGKPVILVRMAFPAEVKRLHLLPDQGYNLPYQDLSLAALLDVLERDSDRYLKAPVHFVGPDPCLNEGLKEAVTALREQGYATMLDTPGIVGCEKVYAAIDFLSVSPKPGIDVSDAALRHAHEFRFYWDAGDRRRWEENISRTLLRAITISSHPMDEVILSVLPVSMELPNLLALMEFCRWTTANIGRTLNASIPLYRGRTLNASIPLYRLLPDINKVDQRLWPAGSTAS